MISSIREILWVVRDCLTTFWFWLPALYAVYLYIQLWITFYVHPLTLLILPTILGIYLIRQEQKQMKTRFGLTKTKTLKSSHALGTGPEPLWRSRWEVEKAVEEYRLLLKGKRKDQKEEK